MTVLGIILKLIGIVLIFNFLRQGVKRKSNPSYHIALGRSQRNQDLIVTLLGFGALLGFILIVFSSNQYLINLIIAVVASFVLAPILAWATKGKKE